MTRHPRTKMPIEALRWMIGAPTHRVLTVNAGRSVVSALNSLGAPVVMLNDNHERCTRMASYAPHYSSLVGRLDALPLRYCSVDVILVGALTGRGGLGSINPDVAAGQMSRVLNDGGWISGWHISRDDSVPWVKKLTRILQSVDPNLMRGTPEPSGGILDSKYFPVRESDDYRLWVPITPASLTEMITSSATLRTLDDSTKQAVTAEVQAVFSQAASFGQLRLPYQMRCWRITVDHQELTQPITLSDGGLVIPL